MVGFVPMLGLDAVSSCRERRGAEHVGAVLDPGSAAAVLFFG